MGTSDSPTYFNYGPIGCSCDTLITQFVSLQVLQTFSATYSKVRAPSFNQHTTMLRTGNYLHHQSHTDWYSILCADDMHKPWLFSLPLAKGLDYTLCKVVRWLESRCWKVEEVSLRLGHVLILALSRNASQRGKKAKGKTSHHFKWKHFSSLYSYTFSPRDFYHTFFSPLPPLFSRSFLRSCLSCHVQRPYTHTHTLGALELYLALAQLPQIKKSNW